MRIFDSRYINIETASGTCQLKVSLVLIILPCELDPSRDTYVDCQKKVENLLGDRYKTQSILKTE